MLITMPTTAPNNTARQMPPCAQARGLQGLACTGNCGQCAAAQPHGGMGAVWDVLPAPFNNPWIVLGAVAVIAFIWLDPFKPKFSGKRRAKLRLIQAQAAEKRAQLLAS